MERQELVVAGNLLVDDLVFSDGRTRMGQPGGAVLYGALAAALWGTRTGCASVRGADYPADALDALRARRVDLAGVRELGADGVRTWLLYEGGLRRVVHRLGSPTHAAVSPRPQDLPAHFTNARAFHLAPMPLEVQGALVEALAANRGALIAIDPHVPVTEATLPQWRALLAQADAFFPGEDELPLEDPAADPRPMLRRLAHGRLRFVAYKRGARGGVLYDAADDRWFEWAARAATVVDPTGAGDAFAAGFLSAHLAGESIERAIQRGVVTASFAIEGWGAAGLLAATRDAAEARMREWFGAEARA